MAERRYTYAPKSSVERAKGLRQESTHAETMLWQKLRANELGVRFRQHPLGGYILDFYCHDARLAIEVDGAQHLTRLGVKRDRVRTARLEAQGIEVLRFNNLEVIKELDLVLERILEELERRRPSP